MVKALPTNLWKLVFSFIQSFKKCGVRNVPIHFEIILVSFLGWGGLGSKDNFKSFDTFEIVVPLFNLASLLMYTFLVTGVIGPGISPCS